MKWLKRLQAFHGENQHANCFLSNCWCCSLWWMEVFLPYCYRNIKELSLLLERNTQCENLHLPTAILFLPGWAIIKEMLILPSKWAGDSPSSQWRVCPPACAACLISRSISRIWDSSSGHQTSFLSTIPWEAAVDHRWFTHEWRWPAPSCRKANVAIRMSGLVPLIGYIYRSPASFYIGEESKRPTFMHNAELLLPGNLFHIRMLLSIRRCKLGRNLPPKFLRCRSGAVEAPIRLSTSVHLFTYEQTRVCFLFLFHWCELTYSLLFRKMKVTAKVFGLDPYGAELKGQV